MKTTQNLHAKTASISQNTSYRHAHYREYKPGPRKDRGSKTVGHTWRALVGGGIHEGSQFPRLGSWSHETQSRRRRRRRSWGWVTARTERLLVRSFSLLIDLLIYMPFLFLVLLYTWIKLTRLMRERETKCILADGPACPFPQLLRI